jgi:hypothetical protein
MSINVGNAHASFTLENSGLRTGIDQSIQLLERLRAQTRRPLTFTTNDDFIKEVNKQEREYREARKRMLASAQLQASATESGDPTRFINAGNRALEKQYDLQVRRAVAERDYARALSLVEGQQRAIMNLQGQAMANRRTVLATQLQGIGQQIGRAGATDTKAALLVDANEAKNVAAAEREFRKLKDAEIAAARAAGEYTEALKLLREEARRLRAAGPMTVPDTTRAEQLRRTAIATYKQEQAELRRTANVRQQAAAQAEAETRRQVDSTVKRHVALQQYGEAQKAILAEQKRLERQPMRDRVREQQMDRSFVSVLAAQGAAQSRAHNQTEQALRKEADAYAKLQLAVKDYAGARRTIMAEQARNAASPVADPVRKHTLDTAYVEALKAEGRQQDLNAKAAERAGLASQRASRLADGEARRLLSSQVALAAKTQDYARAISLIEKEIRRVRAAGPLTVGDLTRENRLLAQRADLIRQQSAATGPPGGGVGGWGLMLAQMRAIPGVSGGIRLLGSAVAGLGISFLGAQAAASIFARAIDTMQEGFALKAEIEQTDRVLKVFLGTTRDSSTLMSQAVGFGKQFGFTQKEMASALRASMQVLRVSQAPLNDTLSVMARLSALNPSEGLEGAAYAIRELATGDIQSITDRFNISRTVTRKWRDEIAAGGDAVT